MSRRHRPKPLNRRAAPEGIHAAAFSKGTALSNLDSLGYSERWRALFVAFADGLVARHAETISPDSLCPARVVRADRGSVLVSTGDATLRAESSARLRSASSAPTDAPAVGDWVVLHTPPGHDVALVEAVLDRTSTFTRGDSGATSAGQVLAANLDSVFVVHPATDPNLRRIERELALTWESGAVPVVVLSKADLAEDPDTARAAVESVAIGVDVHLTSGTTGLGVGELSRYTAEGSTVALIGPSGVGKSTLINAMLGEERQATQEIRVTDGKGRHTTVARELIALSDGGVLVDTPGLRALAMVEAEDGIAAAFPDIEAYATRCRFADCTHESEPGCAVLAATASGELPDERLASYRKLIRESRNAAIRADARLLSEERHRWAIIHKSARRYYRDKGRG